MKASVVLINIADEDLARGDTSGRIGLGNLIADKLNMSALYVDQNVIEKKYSNDQYTYQEKLAFYLKDQNVRPDIIIGQPCPQTLIKLLIDAKDVVCYSENNRELSRLYLNEEWLMPHSLDNDVLEKEGKLFEQHYPYLNKPLIAILLANQSDKHLEIETFSKKLMQTLSDYNEATVFICGGRRNDSKLQRKTANMILKDLSKIGRYHDIDLINSEYDENSFNPYKGLLHCSDHFIVWGRSLSFLSEPLFVGKTVHTYKFDVDERITQNSWAHYFNECSSSSGFKTQDIKPINITNQLADKLIEVAQEKLKNRISSSKKVPLFK